MRQSNSALTSLRGACLLLVAILAGAFCLHALPAFAQEGTLHDGASAPVFTLEGQASGSDALEPAVPSSTAYVRVPWARLAGSNSFGTMAKIAQAGWKNGAGGTVVLATSKSYRDALSATGVAGLYKAPVLVTAQGSLTAETRSELARIKPARVVVAGGSKAISEGVLAQVRALLPKASVARVGGANASDTAAKLNRRYFGKSSQVAILATSRSFRDALSAAPVAYAKGWPVFLSDGPSSISASTLSAMRACGVKQVLILGGEKAIGSSVVSALRTRGISVKARLAGTNGYETSNAIAAWALKNGMSAARAGVATGVSCSDALCGAALCGLNNSVLVLVEDSHLDAVNGVLKTYAQSIKSGCVFGGTQAVSTRIANVLQNLRLSYREVYRPVLLKAQRGAKPFDSMFKSSGSFPGSYYALEDIDYDGIKELVVRTAATGMNGHAYVFTVRNGVAVQCNSTPIHYEAAELGYFKKGGLYLESYTPGMYSVNSFTLKGSSFVSKTMYSHTGQGAGARGYISGDTPAARKFWAANPKGRTVTWKGTSDYSLLGS